MTLKEANKYPEHCKLDSVKEQSQWLGSFIEWGNHNGYQIHEWVEDGSSRGEWYPCRKSINKLLSEYMGIDLQKLESEKEQMLNEIRELNKTK